MSAVLELEHFAPFSKGPNLTFNLEAGASLFVLGPSGSGKSTFLRQVAQQKGAVGKVTTHGNAVLPELGPPRRNAVKVGALLTQANKANPDLVAEILYALRLWDLRNENMQELSPAQRDALEVGLGLCLQPSLLLLDGLLDRLDPWMLESTQRLLFAYQAKGMGLILATNRHEIAQDADALLILDQQRVRFIGRQKDLLRTHSASRIEVKTVNKIGVRALIEPFDVYVREVEDGLIVETPQGQQVAAKLLTEGYNDVRFLIQALPSFGDVIKEVISRPGTGLIEAG